jgi:hypothetical protein
MVLAGCILASSMAFIDGSALTVALPKLRAPVGAVDTAIGQAEADAPVACRGACSLWRARAG